MTKVEFEDEVQELHDEAMRIIRVGHSLPMSATPREVAMFDELIGALDRRIRFVQIKMNVAIAFTREETVGHLPSPRLVNVKQTMINFEKAVMSGEISNYTES